MVLVVPKQLTFALLVVPLAIVILPMSVIDDLVRKLKESWEWNFQRFQYKDLLNEDRKLSALHILNLTENTLFDDNQQGGEKYRLKAREASWEKVEAVIIKDMNVAKHENRFARTGGDTSHHFC